MQKKGFGCLLLFALPFAAVGVGMGIWLGSTIFAHLRMRGWEEVPARIVRTELQASKSSKSTTYRVTAEYVYQYGGRPYRGTAVGLYGGPDNIGSFHQDAHRELSEHQKSDRPFRCYVNPRQPAEAILYRNLRWEMVGFQSMFVLAFGGVGFGLLIAGVLGYRKAKVERALVAAHPDAPWMHRRDWAGGQIVYSAKKMALIALACALFWNLISAPLWCLIPHEVIQKGNRLALMGLVFPLVGLGLIGWTIVSIMKWRKYGPSVFRMAAVPGVIGGQLAGVIATSVKIQPEDGFRLTLNCIERRTTGSGKERNTTETIVWQDEQILARELLRSDPDHSAIPIQFPIPYDSRPTDDSISDCQTIWRLEVASKEPGLDYGARFDVPVFKTPDSDPHFVPDRSAIAEYTAPSDPTRDLAEAGVRKTASLTGDGCRFVFPMGRNLGSVIGLSVFWLIWTGAVVLTLYLKAPLLFPIVFGLFDVIIFLIVLDFCFYRSVIDVSQHGMTVTGGLFGVGSARRVEAANIAKFEAVRGMQSGEHVFYNLVITCRDGKRITAGKRLPGHRLAESVIRQIEQSLNTPSLGPLASQDRP
jgi:hypothetical protein